MKFEILFPEQLFFFCNLRFSNSRKFLITSAYYGGPSCKQRNTLSSSVLKMLLPVKLFWYERFSFFVCELNYSVTTVMLVQKLNVVPLILPPNE